MNYLFDKTWFQKWQKQLLWLLNTPVIRVWFRWVLRIHGFRIKKNKEGKWIFARFNDCEGKIYGIAPNNFTYNVRTILADHIVFKSGGRELYDPTNRKHRQWKSRCKIEKHLATVQTTDFRSHNKFSKRLYYAFYPIWILFHCWDILIANNFAPKLNLGFDTLTVYPAAGANSPVDGMVGRNSVDESFATIIAGAGNEADATGSTYVPIVWIGCSGTLNQFEKLRRAIILFDTSALTANATISAAVLSLWGSSKSDDAVAITPNVDIYTSTPAANNALANADYGQLGSVSQTGSPITYANFVGNETQYNAFTFDATGRGNISKTGISKFGTRNANYDVAAVQPTWTINTTHALQASMADVAGTSNDPKLVVTYTTTIDYSMAAGQGSYALTGQALTMTQALKMTLDQGSYALTGFATALSKGYTLVAEMGSYVLTGFDLTMIRTWIMTMAQGAYTLTGQALTMTIAWVMSLSTGYYTLTGFAIFLLGWLKRVKPSLGVWTSRTKPSIGVYTPRTKPAIGTYTKRTKPIN